MTATLSFCRVDLMCCESVNVDGGN